MNDVTKLPIYKSLLPRIRMNFKTRYVIQKDAWGFYGFAIKHWWWPFWYAPHGHWKISEDAAERDAKDYRSGCPIITIKELE